MKDRNKNFWLGILALVLVFGMTVVGCEKEPEDEGGSTITITGITLTSAEYSRIGVHIGKSVSGLASAYGSVALSGSSATISLVNYIHEGSYEDVPWKETGDFIIRLWFSPVGANSTNTYYHYTNGKTFAELGLNKDSTLAEQEAKLPKYTISSSKFTIDFSKFQPDP